MSRDNARANGAAAERQTRVSRLVLAFSPGLNQIHQNNEMMIPPFWKASLESQTTQSSNLRDRPANPFRRCRIAVSKLFTEFAPQ
jgi:hypothetical protein